MTEDSTKAPVQIEVTQKPAAPKPEVLEGSQAQPHLADPTPGQGVRNATSAPPVALAGVPDTPPSDALGGVGPAVPSQDYVVTDASPNVETSGQASELVGADVAAARGVDVEPAPQDGVKSARNN